MLLLLEPDPLQALLLRNRLSDLGYVVWVVPDVPTARDHCRAELFHLAILASWDARALARELWQDQLLPSVVLYTTATEGCGPWQELSKPYTFSQLHRLIGWALSQY